MRCVDLNLISVHKSIETEFFHLNKLCFTKPWWLSGLEHQTISDVFQVKLEVEGLNPTISRSFLNQKLLSKNDSTRQRTLEFPA